jgi:hypothetical protein
MSESNYHDQSDQRDLPSVIRQRAVFLVPNPCRPDHRVIKQAEYLNNSGFHVRIYCQWKMGLPEFESVNGVDYVRVKINQYSLLKTVIKEKFSVFRLFRGTRKKISADETRKMNLDELSRLIGKGR